MLPLKAGIDMKIDTKTMVSITEANRSFSKVAGIVDEKGSAVILKNNMPKYLIINFEKIEENPTASDSEVERISEMLLNQNLEAYEVLAK